MTMAGAARELRQDARSGVHRQDRPYRLSAWSWGGVRSAFAFGLSLAAHVGIAAAMLHTPGQFGVADTLSDSVSLEVVVTVSTETVKDAEVTAPPAASVAQTESAAAPEPAPPMSSVDVTTPPPAPVSDVAPASPVTAEHSPIEIATPLQMPEPPPELQRTELLATATPEPVTKEAVEPEPIKSEPEPPEEKKQEIVERDDVKVAIDAPRQETPSKSTPSEQASQAQSASIAAAGLEKGAVTAGRASASKGDLIAYAALVRQRLAAKKPSGRGHRGTVVVSFDVSGTGIIDNVIVLQSKASSALENVAVASVRSAGPLPPPPDGKPRTFSVPFQFK